MLSLSLSVIYGRAQSRDTLALNPAQAEALFLKSNYELIVSRFSIDKAKAGLITARLFENPELSYENMLYNPDSRKFFQTSSADGQGQYIVQYSQLLRLAGKRKKNIQLADNELLQSSFDFEDMLRSLRYTLHTDLFKLHFNLKSQMVYTSEIASLEKTETVFEKEYSRGNIAGKELLRIKSLLTSLNKELTDLKNTEDDLQAEIRTMLGLKPEVVVKADGIKDASLQFGVNAYSLQNLIDTALANRPDIKGGRAQIEHANINLRIQKANAVPDITISGVYDLQGSSVKRYTGLGISMPLPLFNRNQGAIKQASVDVDLAQNQLKGRELALKNQVSSSYNTVLRLKRLADSFNNGLAGELDKLQDEISRNYQKRNISLLEFLDFYSSYRENTLQRNQVASDLLCAMEELNYQVGVTVFRSAENQ